MKRTGEGLALIVLFLAINLGMTILSRYYSYLAGVGTWIAYLAGIISYAVFRCPYQTNEKIVTASAVSSLTLLVVELGGTVGSGLEYCYGVDSLFIKMAGSLLLLVSAVILQMNPVSDYYVSVHNVRMNLTCTALSAVAAAFFDTYSVYARPRNDLATWLLLASVFLAILYVLDLVCYLQTWSLSREQTNVLELTATAQMNKSAAQMLTVSEHNLNELRKIRHDLDNQYLYMQVLLRNRDYDGLNDYFAELLGSFSVPLVSYLDCGNWVLNAILNMENAKAQEMGVVLDPVVAVPETLPFREVDLCNLLSNVIDNAMEACVAEHTEKPVVSIVLRLEQDYLYGKIVNPTKKSQAFLEHPVTTTKEDQLHHGKGMSIVRSIVQKYNGHMSNQIEDNMFRVEFLLDMSAGEAQNTMTDQAEETKANARPGGDSQ
ncbi:MAG: ATP-binding protein [Clostridiales bacterium]|nr:ATP-binding protein [Clostridiales bacterium]